ncbi:hypothetical protein A2Y26_03580 [candidate division CPR2 bacterium GWD2_39_7]|nr:MAG: hypothetical protein A2Y26_03580 [candidate division CPR2 bacterium GWD2_39_7]
MLLNPIIESVLEKVKKQLSTSMPSHDWEHTKRVLKLAIHIGEKEGADVEILKLASLLHDIGREEQRKSGGEVCHAEAGAKMASRILKGLDLEPEKVEEVVHCIEVHRSKSDRQRRSLEAKVLYDADKLDGIGAVGIGRAFVFAGEIGARLYDKDFDIGEVDPESDVKTAYSQFLLSSKYVRDWILTEEGRRIAEDRHHFMVDFFERFNHEVEGEL